MFGSGAAYALPRHLNPPIPSLGSAAVNLFIATCGALSAVMRRLFYPAAGMHPSLTLFSDTTCRPSSRRQIPCIVSGRPPSPTPVGDSSVQGHPSVNPQQKSHPDCVNSISRPPLDLARISEVFTCNYSVFCREKKILILILFA